MILTTCISMVLKHSRDLSLDIGSRYERAEHKTYNSNHKSQNWNEKYRTLISSALYVGLTGSGLGVEPDPPDKNFQSPVWESIVFNQWGVKHSQPPDKSNAGCSDHLLLAILLFTTSQAQDHHWPKMFLQIHTAGDSASVSRILMMTQQTRLYSLRYLNIAT